MGGEYPFGHEFNFRGDDPSHAAHVINNWPGKITFSGYEMGKSVLSGSRLTVEGPLRDPVKMAYTWYSGYNASRMSWDPLTLLYAIRGESPITQQQSRHPVVLGMSLLWVCRTWPRVPLCQLVRL